MSRKKSTIDKNNLKEIGARIRGLRDFLGHNQDKLAKLLGISQNSLSEIETGKREPNQGTLLLIKYLFSITPEEILTGKGFSLKKVEYELPAKSGWDKVAENRAPPYDIEELLEDARKILTSGNQGAIDALERNIRYFSHAIDLENQLSEIENRLAELEKGGTGNIKVACCSPAPAADATEDQET